MTEVPHNVAPAGWYVDPMTRRHLRWWNGQAWTESVAPLPGVAPTAYVAPAPRVKQSFALPASDEQTHAAVNQTAATHDRVAQPFVTQVPESSAQPAQPRPAVAEEVDVKPAIPWPAMQQQEPNKPTIDWGDTAGSGAAASGAVPAAAATQPSLTGGVAIPGLPTEVAAAMLAAQQAGGQAADAAAAQSPFDFSQTRRVPAAEPVRTGEIPAQDQAQAQAQQAQTQQAQAFAQQQAQQQAAQQYAERQHAEQQYAAQAAQQQASAQQASSQPVSAYAAAQTAESAMPAAAAVEQQFDRGELDHREVEPTLMTRRQQRERGLDPDASAPPASNAEPNGRGEDRDIWAGHDDRHADERTGFADSHNRGHDEEWDEPDRWGTASVWLVAVTPWLGLAAAYVALSFFDAWSLPALGVMLLPWLIALLFAQQDATVLRDYGHERPASGLWALATAPVYLLARASAIRDDVGFRLAPFWVWAANFAVVGGLMLALALQPGILPEFLVNAAEPLRATAAAWLGR
ncbi:uncharacterized protein DUF2510 [Homoserinimonas aerilata]|uniref:Uncharacterized protein DUF2510 n=1 Tax=Homoserinimonas aerilata TaxID=1162970 RepID=A0A542YGB6_9MICO|nr:DUF2510 domain-containing protein [Homoserinimonas aerilata]TQL47127.1 uncharacterized protein DUF2510 [Homoserinimonas aerilata]